SVGRVSRPVSLVRPRETREGLSTHDEQDGSGDPSYGEPRPTASVLLVHGLGGSHRSGYLRRIANALIAQGMRVYRIDLRGTSASAPHSRRLYNAACSGDVRTALEWIAARNPMTPIVAAGFSLGGNIVLKLAGESATDPVSGLVGVVSVGAPLDLARCSELIR